MDPITSLHSELPQTAAGEVPKFVHLVPAGTSRGVDGRGPFVLGNPAAVMAASLGAAKKLPIDEMHATDHGSTNGQAAPARGWIVAMQSRADGIWGEVEWTPTGKQLMQEKAYAGISPVIQHSPGGQIIRVLRAGLTNVPNLTLTSLNSQEVSMDLNALRKALGLPDTADEAAILAAAAGMRAAITAHSAELQRIAAAAGVAADATGDVIITSLQSQRAAAGNAETMARELVSLQTQVVTLRNDGLRAKATAAIDAAILAGKPIPVVLREHYITRHMADAAAVEKELGAMISLHSAGVPRDMISGHAQAQAGGLDGVTSSIAAAMGADPAKVAATRAARLAGSN